MTEPKAPIARRGLIAGAGAVGAIAAVASVVRPDAASTATAAAQEPSKADATSPGYRLTEHIRRYYATTRI
jgi:cysteine synthase